MPQLDPWIMALGLKLVIARPGQVLQLEYQVPGGPGGPGGPCGPGGASGAGCGGAGEGGDVEPDGVRSGRVGSAAGCGPVAGGAAGSGLTAAGRWAAAAVGYGSAVRARDGDAPRRAGV